ncbi:flagellar hook-associated protein FlgK [Lutibaculum baratangense]|uniref:Flagellar hook-associated protein 1 n=1 Tax=Lutibaculum baratangense AMV1 TaxID=631454 RepID=V4R478_9HYPH|nr:flagellar hook-associated protein FlgK [Lutibaculum baratangense]ESR26762.1 Flagellar hook-associated protein [Lutibaculum baratangense AMV1]
MGLAGVLRNALSGIDVTQAGLDVVSRNVANSSTVGYNKQTLNQTVKDYGGPAFGVKAGEVNRVLDQQLQKQLRGELSGAGYVGAMQSYLERLEISFGAPGAANGVESLYSGFEASLERLITSPENPATRAEFVQTAHLLASEMNAVSRDIQTLRGQAETEISDSVTRINEILKGIANANQRIAFSGNSDPGWADQRDALINELAELMEVKVSEPAANGTVSVMTRSGTLLASDVAMELSFNRNATVGAQSRFTDDPATSTLGTIILSGPGRPPLDMIQDNAFGSGKIGALLDLRDQVLVEAQNSLDAMADAMARAMSTYSVPSSEIADGRSIDASGLKSGDRLTFSYMDGGTEKTVTFIATNGKEQGLNDRATARTDDTVVGIDFTQSDADIAAAMTAALASLGASTTVTENGPKSFDFVDTASSGAAITGLRAEATATSLTGGLAIPLFVDGGKAYTGSFDGGSQQLGFAGRIAVNPALLKDSSSLSVYMDPTTTPMGDPARPAAMMARLQSVELRMPNGNIAASLPASGADMGAFVSRIVSTQAMRASAANQAKEAQTQVVAQLEERHALKSGVSVDEEMTKLIQLQMAYQANARVVQTFQEMLDLLMRI